jgi:uncharacterized protein (DUF4415 family)
VRQKLVRPTRSEDARIARGIAADPDSAPDLSESIVGLTRRRGRPPKAEPKIYVTLRLDRDVVGRFSGDGRGLADPDQCRLENGKGSLKRRRGSRRIRLFRRTKLSGRLASPRPEPAVHHLLHRPRASRWERRARQSRLGDVSSAASR